MRGRFTLFTALPLVALPLTLAAQARDTTDKKRDRRVARQDAKAHAGCARRPYAYSTSLTLKNAAEAPAPHLVLPLHHQAEGRFACLQYLEPAADVQGQGLGVRFL